MSENCIFCKISEGTIPATKIYEDDEMLAFLDIHPAAPVHLLIIPREHIETLADCEPRHEVLLGKMMRRATALAAERGVGYTGVEGSGGFRVIMNVGPGGGQEVYHLHLHVLGGPRPWKALGC